MNVMQNTAYHVTRGSNVISLELPDINLTANSLPKVNQSLQLYVAPHNLELQNEMGFFITHHMSQMLLP